MRPWAFPTWAGRWAWGLLAAWLGLACLLWLRRIAGAFSTPLTWREYLLLALLWPLCSVGLRLGLRGWTNSIPLPGKDRALAAQLLPSVGLALLGAAVTYGTSALGITLLWVAIGSEILLGAAGPWTLPWLSRRPLVQRIRRRILDLTPETASPLVNSAHEITAGTESTEYPQVTEQILEIADDERPWLWSEPAATQEQRRLRLENGQEVIVGSVRVILDATQELAWAHVAFCPPLCTVAEVEIEMQEPAAAKIKTAQVLPQGIRFEVKLPLAATTREVVWSYAAQTTSTQTTVTSPIAGGAP
ncbi:MAG: hypothetical protein SFX18_02230 [Pirellulales bacterium]|nr:hypothetical protein [Pirellulales bacterium]